MTTPADFNLTEWLAGSDDSLSHRPYSEVEVYAQNPELDRLIERVKELTPRQDEHTEEEGPADEAIGSPRRTLAQEPEELAQLREQARQLAAKARLTIRVYQLIGPEIKDIGGPDLKLGSPEKDYALLSHAARVNGAEASPEQWAQIHRRIGQVQFLAVRDTFNAASTHRPEVDVLFSSGS